MSEEKIPQKNNRIYIKKADLYEITKKYVEDSKVNPKTKIPEEIGKVIILIVDKILSKFSYRGYTFKDEMRSEAILACVTAIPKFDITRSDNVFGFLTTTIHWRIHAIIRKEKGRVVKRYEYAIECASEMFDGDIDSNRLDQLVMNFIPDKYKESESTEHENAFSEPL